MKKINKFKKPIILLGLISLFISMIGITIYAAYSMKKVTYDGDVTIGDVVVNSKNYLTYEKYASDAEIKSQTNNDPYSTGYYMAKKMRIDTVCVLEGFQMKASYEPVSISSFTPGVTYYEMDDTIGAYVVASTYQSGKQYYIPSYALNTVKTAYDSSVNKLTVTISGNTLTVTPTNSSESLAVLTVTINSQTGLLTSVTSLRKSASVEGNLRAIIGSDSLSITILDNDLLSSATPAAISTTQNNVTCFASYRNKEDVRIDYSVPYLSQLGLEFSFTTKIPVYVRIHIQDAWISTQFLSTRTERIRYISKDKISGSSPFTVTDDDWYYDASTNVVYHKEMIEPVIENDVFKTQKFTFNINEGYFYYDKSAQAASKITTVKVSFTVDIVQANRAEKLWEVNFEELFS